MDVNSSNYQKLAERTSATASNEGRDACLDRLGQREIRLLHGAMGLCTEAGEFQDALKRYIFYGSDLDVSNLKEECGDIAWYLAEIMNALGLSFEDVLRLNCEKLRRRYPEKFTNIDAVNRDLEAERKVFE